MEEAETKNAHPVSIIYTCAVTCSIVRLVQNQARTTLKKTTCVNGNVTYWPNLFFLWKPTHDLTYPFHPNTGFF